VFILPLQWIRSMTTPVSSQPVSPERVAVRARPRRLWLWFVAGFLIVFVGMSAAVTTYYMHPSGQAVVQCKLWQYYVVQIPRMFQTQNLGPATADSQATVTMLFQHLACSVMGGLGTLGIGWGIHKIKRREAGPAL
jgi:hypothetical protein